MKNANPPPNLVAAAVFLLALLLTCLLPGGRPWLAALLALCLLAAAAIGLGANELLAPRVAGLRPLARLFLAAALASLALGVYSAVARRDDAQLPVVALLGALFFGVQGMRVLRRPPLPPDAGRVEFIRRRGE